MRRLAAALGAIVIMASLVACDDRECLEGHNVTSTTVVFTGKTAVPVTTTTYVCDEYAPATEGDTQ